MHGLGEPRDQPIPLTKVLCIGAMETKPARRILVAGATGYVGGRLVRLLEDKGERLRCLARRPEALRNRVGADTEIVCGDLANPESLPPAFEGQVFFRCLHPNQTYLRTDREHVFCRCPRSFLAPAQ